MERMEKLIRLKNGTLPGVSMSRIPWCDYLFEPVTGCLSGCPYCYARPIAESSRCRQTEQAGKLNVLLEEVKDENGKVVPYPYGFDPTFHPYMLVNPMPDYVSPASVHVGSMTDLFGDWVPTDVILQVFDWCLANLKHDYIFLTQNPDRYDKLHLAGLLPRQFWYGVTLTEPPTSQPFKLLDPDWYKLFYCFKPLHKPIDMCTLKPAQLAIICLEFGNRQDRPILNRGRIIYTVQQAHAAGAKVFMEKTLRYIYKDTMVRELPWRIRERT